MKKILCIIAIFYFMVLNKEVNAHEKSKHGHILGIQEEKTLEKPKHAHIFGVAVKTDLEYKTIEIDTPGGLKTFPVDDVALRVLKLVNQHRGVDIRWREEKGKIIANGIIRRGIFNCECEHLLKRMKEKEADKRFKKLMKSVSGHSHE